MSQVGDTRSTTTGSNARVGYTRVSTVLQTLDQQNAALEAAGVTKTFSDTMSGARQRPAQGRARGRHADPQGIPRGQTVIDRATSSRHVALCASSKPLGWLRRA
jgi:hypothetical protein